MKYIACIFLILQTLLISCVKEIDLNYPESKAKLTLNAVISQGRPVSATVSSTLPYTNTGNSPFYKDALITFYENGILVDTLKPTEYRYRSESQDTIWYYTSNYAVKVQNRYKMVVVKSGFNKISAATYIPTRVVLNRITHTQQSNLVESVEIEIEDPESGDNFFMIELRYVDPPNDSIAAELTSEDPTVELYSYFGILKMPLDPETGDMAFFSDEFFTDNNKTIRLTAQFNVSPSRVNQVIIYSASEDYYEYVRSFEINKAFSENPFAEPIRVKTNVENGFGILGGVTTTIFNL